MDVKTSFVSQAYANARTAAAPQPKAGTAEQGFARLAENLVGSLQEHEAVARATVRDRVVEAYQEILRMPV
jgi:flagellar hook-basal body complex protein FliE